MGHGYEGFWNEAVELSVAFSPTKFNYQFLLGLVLVHSPQADLVHARAQIIARQCAEIILQNHPTQEYQSTPAIWIIAYRLSEML